MPRGRMPSTNWPWGAVAPRPEDPTKWNPKKWGAAGTMERAVRWLRDAQVDHGDRRKFSAIPDEDLAERTGLPLEVVQRARPYVVRRYGE